jgi:hypothetical protein
MKADEIFQVSVQVMKSLLGPEGVADAVRRARSRGEAANAALVGRYREQINDLVRAILDAEDPDRVLRDAPSELKDALVVRYLKNREIFMKTFPDGIEGIDPDPASIWAAIMISPQDEAPQSV